jgi:hypothetical protein
MVSVAPAGHALPAVEHDASGDRFIPGSALARRGPGKQTVSGVILLSTNQFQLSSHELHVPQAPKPSLGLSTIQLALRERGFTKVRMYPNRTTQRQDLIQNQRSILSWLRMLCGDGDGILFALSTTSDEYYKFEVLSRLLQTAFPKARIVAGGPHFVRESIGNAADPVETALRRGLAHAVQVGHAGGFVDLVVRYRGVMEDVTSPGFYWLDRAADRIMGTGRGIFPSLSSLPFVFSQEDHSSYVILNDACRNGCGFCFTANGRQIVFSEETAIAGLRLLLSGSGALDLFDSNPFGSEAFEYYRHIFDEVSPNGDAVLKHSYLDPSRLTPYDQQVKLGNFFIRHSFWGFYVGRDVVTEHSARAIGSRVAGKIRDQRQLDLERQGIARFIGGWKAIRKHACPDLPPHKIILSYIISPFDMRDSALAMIDEVFEFIAMSDHHVTVTANIVPLMPYPGTPIRRMHAADIDLENFYFSCMARTRGRPWKAGIGPARGLLSRIGPPDAEYTLEKLRRLIKEEW